MGWRFVLGLPLAGMVVTGLFLVMSGMIDPGELPFIEPEPREKITVRPQIDEPEVLKPQKPDIDKIRPPEQPETRPETLKIDPTLDDDVIIAPRGDVDIDPGTVNLDREAQPQVRTNPTGFENCFSGSAGAEEHRVRLRFDVAPTGETANIEVVDSTDRCFERSARRAVAGWRYLPKQQDGEAVWRYGVETTIVFKAE